MKYSKKREKFFRLLHLTWFFYVPFIMRKILVICSQSVQKQYSGLISDKRDIFQLSLSRGENTIEEKCCRADLSSGWHL